MKRAICTMVVCAMMPFIAGCPAKDDDALPKSYCLQTRRQALAELEGRKDDDDVAAGIVHGNITNTHPEVVYLDLSKSGTAAICTATAVSSSTAITASHCVDGMTVRYKEQRAKYVESSRWQAIDLAVVVFNSGTFTYTANVINRAPRVGDAITMVGFGQTDMIRNNDSDCMKRMGTNKLMEFADVNKTAATIKHRLTPGDYIHYRSPQKYPATVPYGEDAMTGRGDSGGPIFIDGMLAAAVSFGSSRTELANMGFTIIDDTNPTFDTLYAYETSLFSPKAVALLKKARSNSSAVIQGLDTLSAAVAP